MKLTFYGVALIVLLQSLQCYAVVTSTGTHYKVFFFVIVGIMTVSLGGWRLGWSGGCHEETFCNVRGPPCLPHLECHDLLLRGQGTTGKGKSSNQIVSLPIASHIL